MNTAVFQPAHILLPGPQADLPRWAALACDQFTSEPEYWARAEAFAGSAPSTLRIILPEVYLEAPGTAPRIAAIHAAMQAYARDVLTRSLQGFVYVERETASGLRQGLVGCADLDAYSYERGQTPRIRPSENTVVSRIPPRLAVRRGAALESPHILMMVDDPEGSVIEATAQKKSVLAPLYNFELMLGGGRIKGWAVTEKEQIDAILAAIAALEAPARYAARYQMPADAVPFALAVGDGNHSLATAKAAWEEIKPTLTPEQQAAHPARHCLVELVNIQSPAIEVEPIHRVVFGADAAALMQHATAFAQQKGAQLQPGQGAGQGFALVGPAGSTPHTLSASWRPLAVGALDDILESYAEAHPGVKIDYVHGEDSVRGLVATGAVGFLLPPFEKSDLFRGVAQGGVLPKKTFSMGHATDKRYYLECRKISE